MGRILTRKRQIAARIEAVEGTAETPGVLETPGIAPAPRCPRAENAVGGRVERVLQVVPLDDKRGTTEIEADHRAPVAILDHLRLLHQEVAVAP